MSEVYLTFDATPGQPLCSPDCWNRLCDLADTLDCHTYPAFCHLIENGYCDDLPALRKELTELIGTTSEDPETTEVIRKIGKTVQDGIFNKCLMAHECDPHPAEVVVAMGGPVSGGMSGMIGLATEASDWRPTRTGKGLYSPSTGHWKPATTWHAPKQQPHAELHEHLRKIPTADTRKAALQAVYTEAQRKAHSENESKPAGERLRGDKLREHLRKAGLKAAAKHNQTLKSDESGWHNRLQDLKKASGKSHQQADKEAAQSAFDVVSDALESQWPGIVAEIAKLPGVDGKKLNQGKITRLLAGAIRDEIKSNLSRGSSPRDLIGKSVEPEEVESIIGESTVHPLADDHINDLLSDLRADRLLDDDDSLSDEITKSLTFVPKQPRDDAPDSQWDVYNDAMGKVEDRMIETRERIADVMLQRVKSALLAKPDTDEPESPPQQMMLFSTEKPDLRSMLRNPEALILAYIAAMEDAENGVEGAEDEADELYEMITRLLGHKSPQMATLSTLSPTVGQIFFLDSGSWERYTGKRGGKGWKNTTTGRIVYTDSADAPGHKTRQRQASAEKAHGVVKKINNQEDYTHEDLQTLAEHLPALNLEQLRTARHLLSGALQHKVGRINLKGAKGKNALVEAIRDYVQNKIAGTNFAPREEDLGPDEEEVEVKAEEGPKVADPLDLTPESIASVWKQEKDNVLQSAPELSESLAGSIAASRIMQAVDSRAQSFRDEIDRRVQNGQPVSDEEDEKYMKAGGLKRSLYNPLVSLSGYRPGAGIDDHPLAQKGLSGGSGSVTQQQPQEAPKPKSTQSTVESDGEGHRRAVITLPGGETFNGKWRYGKSDSEQVLKLKALNEYSAKLQSDAKPGSAAEADEIDKRNKKLVDQAHEILADEMRPQGRPKILSRLEMASGNERQYRIVPKLEDNQVKYDLVYDEPKGSIFNQTHEQGFESYDDAAEAMGDVYHRLPRHVDRLEITDPVAKQAYEGKVKAKSDAEEQARQKAESDRIASQQKQKDDAEALAMIQALPPLKGKRATVALSHDGGTTREVAGTQYGDMHIHKDDKGKYHVSHVGTGLNAGTFTSMDSAKQYVQLLSKLGGDWSFKNVGDADKDLLLKAAHIRMALNTRDWAKVGKILGEKPATVEEKPKEESSGEWSEVYKALGELAPALGTAESQKKNALRAAKLPSVNDVIAGKMSYGEWQNTLLDKAYDKEGKIADKDAKSILDAMPNMDQVSRSREIAGKHVATPSGPGKVIGFSDDAKYAVVQHDDGKKSVEWSDSLSTLNGHVKDKLERGHGSHISPSTLESFAKQIAEDVATKVVSLDEALKARGIKPTDAMPIRRVIADAIEARKGKTNEPSPERKSAMEKAAKNAANADIPEQVQQHVKGLLSSHSDMADAIKRGQETDRRLKGSGRYEAEEWLKKQQSFDKAKADLLEFRKMAEENDIDPDTAIASMGGMPQMPKLSKAGAEYVADELDSQGKPVPVEVLADYPDLQAKYGGKPETQPQATTKASSQGKYDEAFDNAVLSAIKHLEKGGGDEKTRKYHLDRLEKLRDKVTDETADGYGYVDIVSKLRGDTEQKKDAGKKAFSVGDELQHNGKLGKTTVEFRGIYIDPNTGAKLARVIARPDSGPPFEMSVDPSELTSPKKQPASVETQSPTKRETNEQVAPELEEWTGTKKPISELTESEAKSELERVNRRKRFIQSGAITGQIMPDRESYPDWNQVWKDADKIEQHLYRLANPNREQDQARQKENENAKLQESIKEDAKRIASLPVFQKKNGWEIVKDPRDDKYVLRHPDSKEEVYRNQKLGKVRDVASDGGEDGAPKPITQPQATTDEPPQSGRIDYANALKIAADDVGQLRKTDVFRVIDTMPTQADVDGMRQYIEKNRPDLAEEVANVALDVYQDRGYKDPEHGVEPKPETPTTPPQTQPTTDTHQLKVGGQTYPVRFNPDGSTLVETHGSKKIVSYEKDGVRHGYIEDAEGGNVQPFLVRRPAEGYGKPSAIQPPAEIPDNTEELRRMEAEVRQHKEDRKQAVRDKTGFHPLSASHVASQVAKSGIPIYKKGARDSQSGIEINQIPGKKTWLMAEWKNTGADDHDYMQKSQEVKEHLESQGYEVTRPYPDKNILAIRKPATQPKAKEEIQAEPEKQLTDTQTQPQQLVRHALDVDRDSIFAQGRKRSEFPTAQSISVDAMKGENAIWYHQGDPGQVLFNAVQTDASDYHKQKASEINAAQKAGYRFRNHRAGRLGTVWVLEKDGKVLTERGAKAIANGTGLAQGQNESGRKGAKSVVEQVSRFVDSLPESTQNNLGALVSAINRSPLGKLVELRRNRAGSLEIASKDRDWLVTEPEVGHDPSGEWHRNLESSLPRFLEKLRHMSTTDIKEGEGQWAVHDRQADAHAVSKHPPEEYLRKQPTQPKAKEEIQAEPKKPVRFEIGKQLTPTEKAEVLNSITDTYKEHGIEKSEIKGYNRGDDPIYGYPHSPHTFVRSDITGAKLRHYIKLPDGRVAHPSELFPNISQSDVLKALGEKEWEESKKSKENEARELRAKPVASRTDANAAYSATRRPIAHSYYAQSPDGSKIVRVDGTDPDDVRYFDEQGYRRVSEPVPLSDENRENAASAVSARLKNNLPVPQDVLDQHPQPTDTQPAKITLKHANGSSTTVDGETFGPFGAHLDPNTNKVRLTHLGTGFGVPHEFGSMDEAKAAAEELASKGNWNISDVNQLDAETKDHAKSVVGRLKGETKKEPWQMTREEYSGAYPMPSGAPGVKLSGALKQGELPESHVRLMNRLPLDIGNVGPENDSLLRELKAKGLVKKVEHRNGVRITVDWDLTDKGKQAASEQSFTPEEAHEKWRNHKDVIETALQQGKPVPAEVLAVYPDLQAKYGKAADKPQEEPKPAEVTAEPIAEKLPAEKPKLIGRGLLDNYKSQGALSASEADIQAEREKFKGHRGNWRASVHDTHNRMQEIQKEIIDATEKQETLREQMLEEHKKHGYSEKHQTIAKKLKEASRDVNRLLEKHREYDAFRRVSAERAIQQGIKVGDHVLADYPDLAEKYNKQPEQPTPQPTQEQVNGTANATEGTDTGRGTKLERTDSGVTAGNGGSTQPRQSRILTNREEHTSKPDLAKVPEKFRQHLNESQQIGVAKAINSLDDHGGFLLADGTGAGKTRQILATASNYADQGKKVIIVAPAEVIKPDWKKGIAEGSFRKDGEAMGATATLVKGDAPLTPGKVHITTYNELGKLKNQVDSDTVVLFDESHYLKNSNSKRGKDGREIGFKAGKVMYATATPADKPLHVAHLLRAGVFGGGADGKFFGKSEDTYRKLGLKQEEIYNRHTGETINRWVVDPKVGHAEVMRRMSGLFDQMTKEGLMLQRSLSMDNVDAGVSNIQLPPEAHEETEKAFEDTMKATDGNKALALMAMRRAQEPHKIPATVNHVQEELAAGRSPIIFLGRVNDSEDAEDDDDSTPDENTARQLKEALIKAGISEKDIGELHGAAATTADAKKKVINNFNNGKHKVLIATIQSGGTGVNLDDTVGNRPRTVIMMTPPLSANDMIQAVGRINRLSTKSNAKVISLVSDNPVDQWNSQLLHNKMKTLGAVLGKDLGELHGKEAEAQSQPFEWGQSLIRQKSTGSTGKGGATTTDVSVPQVEQQPITVTESVPQYDEETREAVHHAARILADLNLDRAAERNGMGYNKFDGEFGAKLAAADRLTDRQVQAAIKMLGKYKNQIASELYQHIQNPKIVEVKKEEKTVTPPPAASTIQTRKVSTRNGDRHIYSFSPGKAFWDARRANKLPKEVSVSKNPKTDNWEAVIWGTSPEHTAEVYAKLKGMGLA